MAENLLINILLGDIHLNDLYKWIKSNNTEANETGEIPKFCCSQADFVTHFLNSVHDGVPCSSACGDASQKTLFTPKSTNKPKVDVKAVKKRSALFSDGKSDSDQMSENFPPLQPHAEPNEENVNHSVVGFNTPKLMKIRSNAQLSESDLSYSSPVSPLYAKTNFNTPKNRRLPNSAQKVSDRSLCLGDFITQKKSSTKKKVQKNLMDVVENVCESTSKKSRRIKPTKLTHKKLNDNFKQLDNSFNFESDLIELPVDYLSEQRTFLVEERKKIANEKKLDDCRKLPGSYGFQSDNRVEIDADVNSVTHRNELDVLIQIYSYILNNNIVLNLTSELYFVVSLLSMKQYEDDSDKFGDTTVEANLLLTNDTCVKVLFKKIHNTIYFAVHVLASLMHILQVLDRFSVKLLIENERVKQYSPVFLRDLLDIYDRKSDKCASNVTEDLRQEQVNVCFMSETDNRENFPTDASFYAFRKQRDLFYEILRIWEQNHFIVGWNFGIALGGKIRSLLNLHGDPVNFRHFARLFKAQLLTTCRKYNTEEGVSETQASPLSTIPNIDADKLCRLKNRLVTKQVSNGINSAPKFTGHQEFYKEFILLSATHAFHAHLKDALVSEILLLNDSKFSCSELEETDTLVDPTTRSAFLLCVKSLRILAKFLGLLESLPYRTDTRVLSEKVLAAEVETRRWSTPSFDLKQTLLNSIGNKTLVLTIPWLTEHLAMLDYVTLRLPYYQGVLELLFRVRLSYPNFSPDEPDFPPDRTYNTLLVRLCLGWLFELPNFPGDLYFAWYSKKSGDVSESLCKGEGEIDVNFTHLDIGYEKPKVVDGQCGKETNLDHLEIVDRNVLYACCPYLEEFKKLLASNSSSGGGGTVVKHITPLTALESPAEVSDKKLKMQLEEAFFSGQPVSVRKTVEFVCERVASACVKLICNSVVPDAKKSRFSEFQAAIRHVKRPQDPESLNQYLTVLRSKSNDFAVECLGGLQDKCVAEAERVIVERVPAAVSLLLSGEEHVQTRDTCIMIASRTCSERVQQWIKSHVNLAIFAKEFNLETQRVIANHKEKAVKDKPAFVLPPGGKNVEHNPNTLSAVKLAERVRELSLDVLEGRCGDVANEVTAVLDSVARSVEERCDVNDNILSVINRMLVDVVLLLLAHHVKILSDKSVLVKFTEHWKTFGKAGEDLFKTIVCPRNVMLIAQSRDVEKSWSAFTGFVSLLLQKGLLSCESFESQCVTMYQNEWNEVTLKHLSKCFQDVVNDFVSNGGNQSDFTYLLSFISEFCSDMEVQ